MWRGVGDIVGGMRRLGYETELRQYPQGWRVNVRRASADPIIASGWAPTPWRAAQIAAWEALTKGEVAREELSNGTCQVRAVRAAAGP